MSVELYAGAQRRLPGAGRVRDDDPVGDANDHADVNADTHADSDGYADAERDPNATSLLSVWASAV